MTHDELVAITIISVTLIVCVTVLVGWWLYIKQTYED